MLLKTMQALEFWDCCNMEQHVIAFMKIQSSDLSLRSQSTGPKSSPFFQFALQIPLRASLSYLLCFAFGC